MTLHAGTNTQPLDSSEDNLIEAERVRRNVDPMLIAAYHQSKALSELMCSVFAARRFLPESEHAAIREATHAAIDAYSKLDKIVCDTGNDLGEKANSQRMARIVAWEAGID